MILIYSEKITSRLSYIVEFLFEIIGASYQITQDSNKFDAYDKAKINYSRKNIDSCIKITPHDLLFLDTISAQNIIVEHGSYPFFFKTMGDLPFDLFAASFYLVSRYEEYLSPERDSHGRYMAKNSVSYKFLELPIIDIWASELKKTIQSRYSDTKFKERKYNFTPTIDIDVAYSYKSKGILRNANTLVKSMIGQTEEKPLHILRCLSGQETDPYDTYDHIEKVHRKYNLDSIFFISVGKFGKYDKNISSKSKVLKQLINNIARSNKIGIHPSYNSNKKGHTLEKEIIILSRIANKPVFKSRQHYLKLNLPETYNRLIKHGINEDYTMGYAEEPGFRAGTCTPFFFYDLLTEKKTTLKVFPFAVMDGTVNQYKNYEPSEAVSKIKELADIVKKVNGNFITIWHNSSLINTYEWKGWEGFYEKVIETCY